jgi:uncharacterized protein (TIGR04255 family)
LWYKAVLEEVTVAMADNKNRFQNPPLNEVVFHVAFPELDPFGQPHIGLFWNEIRDDFPTIKAVPRVGLVPKSFLGDALPDNRVWLLHRSGNQILQIQDDRFLFNWRKTGDNDAYPGFDALYPIFKDYLARFFDFLDGEELKRPTITSFELHYVNHIYEGVWKDWRDVGSIFPFISWQLAIPELSNVKSLRFSAGCSMPEEGELHLNVDTRTHSQTRQPLLNFEIKFTGVNKSLSLDSLDAVFASAHEHIGRAFRQLTTEKAQEHWTPQ